MRDRGTSGRERERERGGGREEKEEIQEESDTVKQRGEKGRERWMEAEVCALFAVALH